MSTPTIPGSYYPREAWGAPPTPGGTPRQLHTVDRTVYHWTTGDTLGRSSQPGWVRAIYEYHTGNRGWADIGYNYLVDRYGSVYEGRGAARVGAHAPGANGPGMGIALLGGSASALTAAAKDAINGLVAWLRGSVPHMTARELGHGSVPGNSTSCPGGAVGGWVRAGRPTPDGGEGSPDDGQPGDQAPDYVVAVVADNDVDEGMARVLGRTYLWRYLDARSGYDGATIGTAVRVGAARGLDSGPWREVHDVGGPGRHETALAVAERIRAREGSSRSTT